MANVDIVIKAVNQTDAATSKVSKNLKDMSASSMSLAPGLTRATEGVGNFMRANAALVGVLITVGTSIKSVLDGTVKYAGEVQKLSQMSGATAEEASRLIQVFDDYNITAQQLTVVTKAMTAEGLTPNIETMAQLADQYNSLGSSVEKNKFLFDKFGRSGADLAIVLSKGGDAIREMNDGVDESLILTDKAIKDAETYRLALDELSDTFEGLKMEIGQDLIPVMIALTDYTLASIKSFKNLSDFLSGDKTWTEYNDAAKEITEQHGYMATGLGKVKEEQEEFNNEQERGKEAAQDNADAIKQATANLDRYRDMLEATSEANKDALDLTRSIADEQRDYEESHADKARELQEATASGNVEAMEAARQGIQELEAQWHESTNKMIFDMVEARLSVDGLTDSELAALNQLGVKKGIYTPEDLAAAEATRQEVEAITQGILLQEDVRRENEAINETLLELEAQKTAAQDASREAQAGVTAETNNTNAAMIQVVGSTQAASQAMANFQAQAASAARATASIRMPGMNTAQAPSLMGASGGSGGKNVNIVVNNPQPQSAEAGVRKALKQMSYMGVSSK